MAQRKFKQNSDKAEMKLGYKISYFTSEKSLSIKTDNCVTSGFHRGLNEIFVFLGRLSSVVW
jgi:hypothetical protein